MAFALVPLVLAASATLAGAHVRSEGLSPSCNPQAVSAACSAWSEEQRPLCHELEQVKCCMHGAISKGSCCVGASAQVRALPLCAAPAAESGVLHCAVEALEVACQDCSGEACASCHEEEQVKCCIRHGGSKDLCCPAHSAGIRAQSICQQSSGRSEPGAAVCDPEAKRAACQGCAGEQCRSCGEEEDVKCCLAGGGSRGSCCDGTSADTKAKPVCRGSEVAELGSERPERWSLASSLASRLRCSSEVADAACGGCTGEEACQRCYGDQDVRCCISNGGSTDLCCEDASDVVRAEPICQASASAQFFP